MVENPTHNPPQNMTYDGPDEIVRATLIDGEAVAFVARTTRLCEAARVAHGASPLAAAALGRTLTMTAMMSLSSLKNDEDRLTVTVNGHGPIGKIVCGGRAPALVKGYVENPTLDLPLNAQGKLDVGQAVGRDGTVTVIRDLGLKEPYVGRARLVSGEIAEDFALYFTVSEQTPSLVALGVHVNRHACVDSAGGVLIQALPGCSEESLTRLEALAPQLSSVSTLMACSAQVEEVMQSLFGDMRMHVLQRQEPAFCCDCSRERIERALIAMGYDELKSLRDEDGKAQLWCNFCNRTYDFTGEQLDALLASMRR